jgi:xanthine dehydrogenase/oxidase
MCHIDSVYNWQNADIIGHACWTNLQSATAFRGFGAPQGMFATETIMTHIAEQCNIDVNEVNVCISERGIYY